MDGVSKLIVEGHTDSDGSADSNKTLSQGRAEAVKQLLVEELNIDTSLVEVDAIGYGEERPVATNNTRIGKAKNRRVQLKLYKK